MRSCPLEREKRGKASQWANGLSVVKNNSWLIKLGGRGKLNKSKHKPKTCHSQGLHNINQNILSH